MFKSFLRKLSMAIFNWADKHSEKYDDSMSSHNLGGISQYNSTKARSATSNNIGDFNHGMNFTVFSATGGKVIQLTNYDPRTDRTNSALYIITDSENLGEELAHIITRESLTR